MRIDSKDGVIGLLERLEKVLGQVRDLDETVLAKIALGAGCLVSEISEIGSDIEQGIDIVNSLKDTSDSGWYEESELNDYGYYHENEINVKDNPELMMRAVHSMHRASNDDQRSLILAVLEAQDVVTEATELSALLHRTKLDIRAIDTDTLETVLTVLRNPFNEELAEKIQGETDEIDF